MDKHTKPIEVISCIANKTWVSDVLNAGADAIYCGLINRSWYNTDIELTWGDLVQVGEIAHKSGKKLYLAINRDLSTEDVDEILNYIDLFENDTFDGIILSDWGCIEAIRKRSMKVYIHLSANTGCVNDWDFKLAKEMKIQRIILSPSLEFERIREIIKHYKGFEWEAITYGMMCSNETGLCPCQVKFNDITLENVCCHQFNFYENKKPNGINKVFGRSLLNGDIAEKFYELGINHWKLEGRAKGLHHIMKGTEILRNMANIIER